jgi:hypothetical protein
MAKAEKPTPWVEVEFIKNHGAHKKGEKAVYHESTVHAVVERLKVAKVVKKHEKYVPKKASL